MIGTEIKRLVLLVYIIGLPFAVSSQVPEGYYDSAEGLSGVELKTALYQVIKGHTEFPYTASSTDTWDILKESDRDPENDENVILFYTGWSVNAAQEYNNETGWNREHVWAKSRGDFGTLPGPGTDTHHLRPSDITVNYARGNRWFDNCTIPYVDEGQETGCFTSESSWIWQPRDEVKGDVARMIFYMATRYEGENGEPDLEVIDYLPENNFTYEPVHARLSTLLTWHQEDSVDRFEQNRNEVVYDYQGNRNPFIDHPEYAEGIWGTNTRIGNDHASQVSFRVYPNPSRDLFTIEFESAGDYSIEVSSINGQVLYRAKTSDNRHRVDMSSFPKGLYLLHIWSGDLSTIQKIIRQ